jgi:hypothetical protein
MKENRCINATAALLALTAVFTWNIGRARRRLQ